LPVVPTPILRPVTAQHSQLLMQLLRLLFQTEALQGLPGTCSDSGRGSDTFQNTTRTATCQGSGARPEALTGDPWFYVHGQGQGLQAY
jgi:hypothetical protein